MSGQITDRQTDRLDKNHTDVMKNGTSRLMTRKCECVI